MKKLLNRLNVIYRWIRGYISPVFIVLFCASFILWYIIKLGNVYTTNYDLRLNIDGESLRVPCVVEGVGTNLLGYNVYQHKELRFSLSDLKYAVEQKVDEQTGEVLGRYCIIDNQSLQNAITLRFSDIKVLSVGDIPLIPLPETSDTTQVSK
ncbi:MAG: hypothetical protein J6J77_04575 [Alistipes sp.]|nr:hypothetical protein [Alistipes sp.]MBR2007507.1 hypothetical protein [Alistipes sp.]